MKTWKDIPKLVPILAVILSLLMLAPLPADQNYVSRYYSSNVFTGGNVTGNLQLIDPASLAAESLGQPTDFSAGWTVDGAICVINAGSIKCTGPGTGTFTQTSANAASNGGIAWASPGINGWFIYAPTISNVAGTPACTVTTAFAAAATAIPNATASTPVQAKSTTVGDFVTSCVLGAGATIWFDAVSLKQINGGSLTVQGGYKAGFGTAAAPAYSFVADPATGMFVAVSTGQLGFSLAGVSRWQITTTNLYPVANDTAALGGASNQTSIVYTSRGLQGSKSKALTDAAAAVAVIRVPVASNGHQNGNVIWDASSNDGTDYRSATGTIHFASISKGATPTCTVNVMGTDLQASSNANTLVCTWTNVVNSTNCDLSVSCTDNTAGTQTMSINFRPDMTTTATLVYP
jgi:hypothetical protein